MVCEIDGISSLLRHLSHYYHPLHKSRERIAERTKVHTDCVTGPRAEEFQVPAR